MNSKDEKTKLQKVAERNAKIVQIRRRILICRQEEKRQLKDQLECLEAEYRQEMMLGSFEVKPRETWYELDRDERHDKGWVLKAADCGTFDQEYPWRYVYFDDEERRGLGFIDGDDFDEEWMYTYYGDDDEDNDHDDGIDSFKLPRKFHLDRDIFLAYVRREAFAKNMKESNLMFRVPCRLRRDREVMMEVCAKNGTFFLFASGPLRDDEDLVMVAHLASVHNLGWNILEYVSDRLRGDKEFIINLIKSKDIKQELDFGFLESIKNMFDIYDEIDIASSVLQKFDESKKRCLLTQLPTCFSRKLYDDEEIMIKFVQHHWQNIQSCSDRLRSRMSIVDLAISQSKYAQQYALGRYKENWIARQKSMGKAAVLHALRNQEACFDNISDDLKNDIDVLEIALQTGEVAFSNLSVDLRQNKQLIFAAAAAKNGNKVDECFLQLIPECWHGNEDFVLALLNGKRKSAWALGRLFRKFPALCESREVMIAVANFPHLGYLLRDSPFGDDEEIMFAAIETDFKNISCASERLLDDRNFVSKVFEKTKNSTILSLLTDDFLENNVDIAIQAIECYPGEDGDDINLMWILGCVLHRRDVIMACIRTHQRGILYALNHIGDDGKHFTDDEDIVRRVLRYEPSQLVYASRRLLNDRDFILSVIGICGRDIASAVRRSEYLRRDDDILAAAIASDVGTFFAFFHLEDILNSESKSGDFEWLVGFALRIRSRLFSYDSFFTILNGISCHRPNVAPFCRCYLHHLDRGEETSTMFKRLIAEYAGVPLGNELQQLRKVSTNLLKFGF